MVRCSSCCVLSHPHTKNCLLRNSFIFMAHLVIKTLIIISPFSSGKLLYHQEFLLPRNSQTSAFNRKEKHRLDNFIHLFLVFWLYLTHFASFTEVLQKL